MFCLPQDIIFLKEFDTYIPYINVYLLAVLLMLMHYCIGRQNSEKPFSGLFIAVIHVFIISMFYCQI